MTTQVKIIILVAIVAILGSGAYLISNNKSKPSSVASQTPSESVPNDNSNQDVTKIQVLTAEEVAEHNQANDCWTIISGSVYDITEYVPRHPGGNEILLACGADGTSLFTTRTTNKGETIGSGTPHSSTASGQLKGYLIGTLE